jgi:hypothetical protein
MCARWARKTNAMNVNGYNPALPPGMTERVNVHGRAHADRGDGRSMWAMVLEHPSED